MDDGIDHKDQCGPINHLSKPIWIISAKCIFYHKYVPKYDGGWYTETRKCWIYHIMKRWKNKGFLRKEIGKPWGRYTPIWCFWSAKPNCFDFSRSLQPLGERILLMAKALSLNTLIIATLTWDYCHALGFHFFQWCHHLGVSMSKHVFAMLVFLPLCGKWFQFFLKGLDGDVDMKWWHGLWELFKYNLCIIYF